jgi:hypothetical protein
MSDSIISKKGPNVYFGLWFHEQYVHNLSKIKIYLLTKLEILIIRL